VCGSSILTYWRDSAAGAVAELFDVSSLACSNSNLISTIHNDLFNFWNSPRAESVTVQQLIEALPNIVPQNMILSQHFFITNAAGGISPVWDFRATQKFKGVDNAVFVGKALANTPDVNPTKNVPWLHLGKVSGGISDEIYRIFTVGGVAPSSVSSHPVTIAGAFAPDPVDGCAYVLILISISVLVGRRRISPSNTLLNIGFMAVPWDWVPSNCFTWGAPAPLATPYDLGLMQIVEGIEWVHCACLSSGSAVGITSSHVLFSQGHVGNVPFRLCFGPIVKSVSYLRVHNTHSVLFLSTYRGRVVSKSLWSCASLLGPGWNSCLRPSRRGGGRRSLKIKLSRGIGENEDRHADCRSSLAVPPSYFSARHSIVRILQAWQRLQL